jgi:hypothetical protein
MILYKRAAAAAAALKDLRFAAHCLASICNGNGLTNDFFVFVFHDHSLCLYFTIQGTVVSFLN